MNNFKKKFIFLSLLFSMDLFSRVLISPIPDYYSIFKESSFFKNEDLENKFFGDLNVTFVRRNANNSYSNSGEINNLSSLFAGSDSFDLNDIIGPISIDNSGLAISNSYTISPNYFWENNSCRIEANFQKNITFLGREMNLSAKVNVPFEKNRLSNTDVTSMISANSGNIVKKNKGNFSINDIEKINYISSKDRSREDFVLIENRKLVDPRVKIQTENGNDVFAIRADYAFENYFKSEDTPLIFEYLAFNKMLPAAVYTDVNGKTLNLEAILDGKILISDAPGHGIPMHLEVPFSSDTVNQRVKVKNIDYGIFQKDPFLNPVDISGALIPIYKYYSQSPNELYLTDKSYQYDLSVSPNFIQDNVTGGTASFHNIIYCDAFTNKVSEKPISGGSFIKIIATGKYGLEPFNQNHVSFIQPPLIIQKTKDSFTFPETFGLRVNMPNHFYADTDGVQFVDYNNQLTNVALLNKDGTFSNNASNAVFWYANDYSELFKDTSKNKNLENLFITSSLDENNNLTPESMALSSIIDQQRYDPTAPLEQRVTNLEAVIFNDEDLSNQSLYNKIQDLENGTIENNINNVNGSIKLLASEVKNSLEHIGVSNFLRNNEINIFDENQIRFSSYDYPFANGQYQKMQYDDFYQDGIGDISFELKLGSSFKENKFYGDIFTGIILPTSRKIDGSDSYLAVPLSNNGHSGLRLGLEGIWNNEKVIRSSFFAKGVFDFTLKANEKMVPQIINPVPGKLVNDNKLYTYPVFGAVPLKMDVSTYWTSFTGNLGGMFLLNDFAGFNLNYQFWYKWKDNIKMLGSNLISSIKGQATSIKDPAGGANIQLAKERIATFSKIEEYSKRYANTIGGSIFVNFNEDFHLNIGISKVIYGKNIPESSDYSATLQIDF